MPVTIKPMNDLFQFVSLFIPLKSQNKLLSKYIQTSNRDPKKKSKMNK